MDKKLPSISVIIPTYKPNDLIADAIRSCLEQDYPKEKIEVIVSVNGKDAAYAQWLTAEYKNCPQVRVVYTPVPGLGSGRNFAKQFLRTEFVTYLDDDDYFTTGYLKELANCATVNATVVCGRLENEYADGTWDTDNNVNKTLRKIGAGEYAEPWPATALYSSACMKLYRTSQVVSVWGDFDETLPHTEDVTFWVENIYKPMGSTVVASADSKEAYVRRITDGSMSRPDAEKAFAFYVTERIALIKRFSEWMLQEDKSIEYKYFVKSKIDASVNHMHRYYLDCSPEEKRAVAEAVKKSDNGFLNKSKFGITPAIAFCHEFMQLADATGFAAAKRLDQISAYAESSLNWTVVRGTGRLDKEGEEIFAKYRYTEKYVIPGSDRYDESSQKEWAEKAFAVVQDQEAAYIYSSGRFACSHDAALKYKRAHPETVWIAEISGLGDTSSKKNSLWRELEDTVCKEADKLIFSNEDQNDYLQERTPAQIADKALVWPHLPTDTVYAQLVSTKYKIDPDAINIACFELPAGKRQVLDLLTLLKNPKVQLYVFSKLALGRAKILTRFLKRIHICPPVSCVEEVSVAQKMDYLYLSDPAGEKSSWPYLPERLADYLSAETPIIAKVYPNTPMSKMEHERLIKVETVDAEFVAKLKKR